MDAQGVPVCERSLILAMAACLESHRDSHEGDDVSGPRENGRRLAQEALALFDRLVASGTSLSATAYALALKVLQKDSCTICNSFP